MVQDGDNGFIGLDMRRDPATVQQGYYTIGEHIECEDSTLKTRKGNLTVPWGDTYRYTEEKTLRPIEKHGTIIDVIRFADTEDGKDYLLLCKASKAVLCLPGSKAADIEYPPGYTPADNARLLQAFDKVFLLGGIDRRPLVWSGDSSEKFEFADTGSLPGGYEYMPFTRIGCYHKNRIWVTKKSGGGVSGRSTVLPSDILEQDFKTVNEFFVNQGDSDEVLALVPYTSDRIIAFKNNSMYSLDNLVGTLDSAEINLISNNIGIVSDRSAQVLGPLVIWLSRKGVMSAQLAYEQRLTPDTVPLSEPIEPIIRRINWTHAEKAVGVIHNDRYYLAVPLDDNTQNSAVLVYNFKTQAWESIDAYDPETFSGEDGNYDESFGPQTMNVIKVFGKELLLSTTHAGCLALYRYCEGKPDRAYEGTGDMEAWLTSHSATGTKSNTKFVSQELPFVSRMQTRGYLGGDATMKHGSRIDLTIDTFNPKFDLDLVSAGPGESSSIISSKTRDRTKRRDFVNSETTTVIDNQNNEHTSPYLDDYSVQAFSTYNSQTTSEYPEFYFGAGSVEPVYISRPQEFSERFRIYKRARAPRILVTNRQGYVKMKGVHIEQYQRGRNLRRSV